MRTTNKHGGTHGTVLSKDMNGYSGTHGTSLSSDVNRHGGTHGATLLKDVNEHVGACAAAAAVVIKTPKFSGKADWEAFHAHCRH